MSSNTKLKMASPENEPTDLMATQQKIKVTQVDQERRLSSREAGVNSLVTGEDFVVNDRKKRRVQFNIQEPQKAEM